MSIIDIDIDKVVTAAKKFGTHFEIITHDVADTFVKNLASALRSAGVDVVVQEHNNYKFYFEDNGSQLSSYARMSFDGNPLPEEWTTVTMTDEETAYLSGRLTSARKLQRATQPEG